jgi:hypothetical protein
VGDYPIRQLILHTRILVGWFSWELNPGVLGSLSLKALRLGGDHFGWRPPSWGGGPCPFFSLCPGIHLTNEQNHGKPQSGQPSSPGTARCADLALFWGTASAGLLDVRSPRLPGWLQSALGPHRCLRICRTKGFPASANFQSKISVSVLMWSAKNGIPKSSWICLLPAYKSGLLAMRRHSDCSSCSFRTWLLAADLQIGHA